VYPPQRRLLEIPWGKGDLKKQFIKDSLKLSWNFQRAGIGFINTKNNKFTETFLSFLQMTSESIVSLLFFLFLHIYKGKGLSLSDTCNEIDGLYSLFA